MEKISLTEFLSLKYLSSLTYSPTGKRLLFVQSEANEKENKYCSYIMELKGKTVKKLTSFGSERGFKFVSDDEILFAGNRSNKKDQLGAKLYSLNLKGGEAEKAYEFPIGISGFIPTGNKNLVLLGDTYVGFEELYKGDKKLVESYKKHLSDEEDYEVVSSVPWWHNGGTFTRGSYSTLYKYINKSKKLVPLTPWGESVFDMKLSPDKKTVYYTSKTIGPDMSHMTDSTLKSVSLETGETKTLFTSKDNLFLNDFEPADSFMYLILSDNSYGLNTDGDFYALSYETGEIKLLAPYKQATDSSVGSDIRYMGGRQIKAQGDTLYFITTLYDDALLYKLENGVISAVTNKEGSVDTFDVSGDKLSVIALYNMQAQEIYDASGNALTKINKKALSGKYVATPKPLNVDRGEYTVHGFVLEPINYVPGQKYPVIIDIHGGPKTVYGKVFYHEMQYWASEGYFVIFCNPTGSDGRGVFSDIRGKYGSVDYDDIMAFCDEALKNYPDMDDKNFFETGGSYGGFMTNWIIGHTNRFSACVSQRSISNWPSFYGVSDIGPRFTADQQASTPWEDGEKLWSLSPLKYADKAKTPTLFIHAFEDYRCPIDQGYQMYTALITHGVESKMVLFKGENHELSRSGKPKHRLRRLKEITKWFEAHKK